MYKGREGGSDVPSDGHDATRHVTSRRNICLDNPIKSFIYRQRISICKQPLLSPPGRCITLIFTKRYEINVLLSLSFVSPSSIHPRELPRALEREIDNGSRTRWIYKDCLPPGKAGGLVEVSISDLHGRLYHCCYALESNRRKNRLPLFLSVDELHSRVS